MLRYQKGCCKWVGKKKGSNRCKKFLVEILKDYTTTFGELCLKYEEAFDQQAAWKNSKRYIIKYLKKYFGENTPLSQISYHALEKFRNDLRNKKTVLGTPRTIRATNHTIAILRHMLRKAKSWGLIGRDPFLDGDQPKARG